MIDLDLKNISENSFEYLSVAIYNISFWPGAEDSETFDFNDFCNTCAAESQSFLRPIRIRVYLGNTLVLKYNDKDRIKSSEEHLIQSV